MEASLGIMYAHRVGGLGSSGRVAFEELQLLNLPIDAELSVHAIFRWVDMRLPTPALKATGCWRSSREGIFVVHRLVYANRLGRRYTRSCIATSFSNSSQSTS